MYGDIHAAAVGTWEHYYENPRQFQAYNTTVPCPPPGGHASRHNSPYSFHGYPKGGPAIPRRVASHAMFALESGHDFNQSLAAYGRLEVQIDSTNVPPVAEEKTACACDALFKDKRHSAHAPFVANFEFVT